VAGDIGKLRVLVIASSVRLRRLIVSILNASNMKIVYETGSGQEGFLIFRERRPDLVVADWDLGTMNGIELVHLVRRDPLSPARRTPVILVVVNTTGVDRITEARNAGVTGLVLKPFSAHHLLKHVGYAVDDPRAFIETPGYVGPDRRRKPLPEYEGPLRRGSDCG
jgi:two-component system, chemotaxis family, chemotaxis protein CheY